MDQPQCQTWPCTRSISCFSFFPPPCFFSVYIFLIGNWFIMHIELIFHYLCIYLRRPLRRFVTNLTFICNTIRENGGRMLTVLRFFFLCSAAQHYFSYLAFDYSISAIIRAPFACHNKQRSSNTLKTVSAYFPNMISQFSTSFEKRYLWRRRRRSRRCLCRCHCEN